LSQIDGIIGLEGGEAARISEFWGQQQLTDADDRLRSVVIICVPPNSDEK
jgi:hypothetical protein